MKYSSVTLSDAFEIDNIFSYYHLLFDSDYRYKGEQHFFWEMVYVIDGKIGVAAANLCYEIAAGTAVFHKPGEYHSLWSAGGTSPEVLIITFSCNDIIMKKFENKVISLEPSLRRIMNDLQSAFDKIVDHCENDDVSHKIILKENFDAYDCQAAKNLLEYVIISLSETASVGDSFIKSQIQTSHKDIYRKSVDYLNSNICSKVSIDDVCNYVGVAKTTLKTIFAKYSGNSIMKYYLSIKINRAKIMLQEGKPVGEVSDSLGFTSQNYFCYAFKREVGIAPLAYKKSKES